MKPSATPADPFVTSPSGFSYHSHAPNEANGHVPPSSTNGEEASVPIAIIGMACRLPGENSSPSKLWDFLVNGKSGWKPKAPKDRFNWDAFNHPDPDFEGTITVAGGHYNDYVDLKRFDSQFFGLPQAEALCLDPQQRMLLETSYECLENAGIPMEDIAGKKVGCFIAFSMGEYGRLWDKDLEHMMNYHAVGTGEAIYANRISHVYDLAGPSLSFDTGCSGGMVGLDLACRHLASGAIDASFVGGTNLTLIPEVLGRMPRLLSKSGKCHTFDSRADGFTRADGTNILYVKRLADAIRDGDPIRAVVKATATNFDGRTPGILMPSMTNQIANMRQAYAKAGISDLSLTGYMECHGTGTPTGDPIEVEAVGKVFSSSKSTDDPLLVGSVKTNLGHSEAASALTSIIKNIFILESGIIPPTIEIIKLSPNIDFEGMNIKVVQNLTPFPNKSVRRVSINAFGYGGANAHTILEAAENFSRPNYRYTKSSQGRFALTSPILDDNHSFRPYLMLFSANDPEALKNNVQRLNEHTSDRMTSTDRLDLAYTLSVRRSKLYYRGFSVLGSENEIPDALVPEVLTMGKKEYSLPPRIGFVLTGQGAQRPQMGKDLIEKFPSVSATLLRLDGYLQELRDNRPSWSIKDELLKPEGESQVHDPRFAQTLTCAMQIAIINLLLLWGVKPSAVVGHSSGEIPAAYAAGYITERMAIMIGYFRGFSITSELSAEDRLWNDCGMLATGLSREAIAEYLEPYDGDLVVACDNSPESTTISGDMAKLRQLDKTLVEMKVFSRLLKVSKAYHNPKYMGNYSVIFKRELENAGTFEGKSTVPQVPMYSTAQLSELEPKQVLNGEYWRQNMESPVLFRDAVSRMLAEPEDKRVQILIEIGPSSTLKGPIRQILKASKLSPEHLPKYIPTMIGGSNAAEDLLRTVGSLFTLGCPVDLEKVNSIEMLDKAGHLTYQSGKLLVDLPNYAWNHSKEMWFEPRASRNHRFREHIRHEILGSRVPDSSPITPTWRNVLTLGNTKWLPHHKLHDDIVFPAAGYITMAIEAIRQHTKDAFPAAKLRNVSVTSALVMNNAPAEGVYTFLTLTRCNSTSDWYDFTVCSERQGETEVHCSGQVAAVEKQTFAESEQLKSTSKISGRQWYKHFSRIGYNYSDSFQVIEHISAAERKQTVCSLMRLPEISTLKSRYLLSPAVIDGAMQTLLASAVCGKPGALNDLCIPSMFDEIYVAPTSFVGSVECIARIDSKDRAASKSGIVGYSEIRTPDGEVVLSVKRLACTKIDSQSASIAGATQIHKVVWKPDISLLDVSTLPGAKMENGWTKLVLPESDKALQFTADLLGHHDPAAKILEICGGDGSVTMDAMAVLNQNAGQARRFGSYTFTDIDESTFSQVKEKLGSVAHISYKTLDIAQDPVSQGQEKGAYDVIIASTHDATDLNKTISNIRPLLKSGGRLVLIGACLKETNDLLFQNAFSGIDIEISDTDSEKNGSSILISTAIEKKMTNGTTHHSSSIMDQKSRISAALSLAIATKGNNTETFIEVDDGLVVFASLSDPQNLAEMSEETLDLLKSLAKKTTKPIIWITQNGQIESENPFSAMFSGLSRVLSREDPELCLISLDIDSHTPADVLAELTIAIFGKALHQSEEREYAIRNGIVYTQRTVPDVQAFEQLHETEEKAITISSSTPINEAPRWKVEVLQPGLLQSLTFFEVPEREWMPLGEHEVEIEMRAVGVNFKDVAISMGIMPHKDIGVELAGVVTRVGSAVASPRVGERVAGLPYTEAGFRTHVRCVDDHCFVLPDDMSFEEACTMPCVHTTNILGMIMLAQMKKGQTILIHSAAGGVGISAIQIARHIGAEIYATCGSDEKRKFLVETMGLNPSRIFYSRSAKFQQDIMLATNNRGVDVVLNSLSSDLLEESWNCVAEMGCHLDVSKVDFKKRHKLGMRNFDKSTSFHSIDATLFPHHAEKTNEIMAIMKDLIYKKAIGPITPITYFHMNELESAFRLMQSGKSHGKLVIRREIADSKEISVRRAPASLSFPSNASYLLIGGLGGIGRSIVRWMFDKGARSFIFLSPSGDDKPQAKDLTNELQELGATAIVIRGNVANMTDVDRAMAAAPENKPIMGMIHAAMVLTDQSFSEMSATDFKKTADPKVKGAFNLHTASLALPKPLDFFIMLSSVSGVFGNHGQSNYAAANTFLDALAAHRLNKGLAATALDLGFVEDIGWATENEELDMKMEKLGILSTRVKEREILDLLELNMLESKKMLQRPLVASNTIDKLTFESRGQIVFGLSSNGSKVPKTYNAPRFRALLNVDSESNDTSIASGASAASHALIEALKSSPAPPLETITPLSVDALAQKISEFLLVPVEEIDVQRSLESMGIDSLVAMELRTWYRESFGVKVSTIEILKSKSFRSLGETAGKKMLERLEAKAE